MIDLHLHTTASDGNKTPEEVLELSKQAGLTVISITDHDTVEGLKMIGKEEGVEVIPGIELGANYREGEVHVLGYHIDINNEALNTKLAWLRNKRKERAEKMINKLIKLGIIINKEEVMGRENVSRRHIAEALIKRGVVSSIKQAFKEYLSPCGRAYVKRTKLGLKESIRLIRQAGGVPVLAHPGEYRTDIKELLKDAKEAGIKGIEVYHPSNNEELRKDLIKFAEENDLIMTGGSDYHGKGAKNEIGIEDVPDSIVKELINEKKAENTKRIK